jgi:hypothetical protein
MVEPSAHIRPYETNKDDKQVRFVISKANFATLAIANRQGQSVCSLYEQSCLKITPFLAYIHPLAISSWIALACIFVQLMGWWPNPEYGYVGYLSPIPAFGATAVPVMFLIDWLVDSFFRSICSAHG